MPVFSVRVNAGIARVLERLRKSAVPSAGRTTRFRVGRKSEFLQRSWKMIEVKEAVKELRLIKTPRSHDERESLSDSAIVVLSFKFPGHYCAASRT